MLATEIETGTDRQLRVSRVASTDELVRLAEEWNNLAGDVPFRRWEWLATWWRHFQTPQDELCILCLRDTSDQLVGLAPWYLRRSPLQGHVVRFLGSGEVCSDDLTILSDERDREAVADCLANWLTCESNLSWDAIEISGVDADDLTVQRFAERLSDHAFPVHGAAGLRTRPITIS